MSLTDLMTAERSVTERDYLNAHDAANTVAAIESLTSDEQRWIAAMQDSYRNQDEARERFPDYDWFAFEENTTSTLGMIEAVSLHGTGTGASHTDTLRARRKIVDRLHEIERVSAINQFGWYALACVVAAFGFIAMMWNVLRSLCSLTPGLDVVTCGIHSVVPAPGLCTMDEPSAMCWTDYLLLIFTFSTAFLLIVRHWYRNLSLFWRPRWISWMDSGWFDQVRRLLLFAAIFTGLLLAFLLALPVVPHVLIAVFDPVVRVIGAVLGFVSDSLHKAVIIIDFVRSVITLPASAS